MKITKKKTAILILAIITLVIAASAYSAYILYFSPEAKPQKETVAFTDVTGTSVNITVPVERIVSLDPGLTEILCILGCEDRIVGRGETSDLPPSILDKPVVGDDSYSPNVELLLELEPDLVFANSMLPYNTASYEQIKAAGIPVFILDPNDPMPEPHSNETVIDYACNVVSTISSIVGEEQKANEYLNYAQYYDNLVEERIKNLARSEKPKVLLEWYEPYWTFVNPGVDQAGGISIAENQTEYAPVLSSEFVVEQNPDVIIRGITLTGEHKADLMATRDEILGRPELSDVNAIKNGRVYIYAFDLRSGIRCAVGHLYWAKWCQPNLFADIDPAAVNAELNQKFYGIEIPGVYVYP